MGRDKLLRIGWRHLQVVGLHRHAGDAARHLPQPRRAATSTSPTGWPARSASFSLAKQQDRRHLDGAGRRHPGHGRRLRGRRGRCGCRAATTATSTAGTPAPASWSRGSTSAATRTACWSGRSPAATRSATRGTSGEAPPARRAPSRCFSRRACSGGGHADHAATRTPSATPPHRSRPAGSGRPAQLVVAHRAWRLPYPGRPARRWCRWAASVVVAGGPGGRRQRRRAGRSDARPDAWPRDRGRAAARARARHRGRAARRPRARARRRQRQRAGRVQAARQPRWTWPGTCRSRARTSPPSWSADGALVIGGYDDQHGRGPPSWPAATAALATGGSLPVPSGTPPAPSRSRGVALRRRARRGPAAGRPADRRHGQARGVARLPRPLGPRRARCPRRPHPARGGPDRAATS